MIAFFLLSFLEYDTIIMKEMVNFMRIKDANSIDFYTPGLVITPEGEYIAMEDENHETFFQNIIGQLLLKKGISREKIRSIGNEHNLAALMQMLLSEFCYLPYQGCTSGKRQFTGGILFVPSLDELCTPQLNAIINLINHMKNNYDVSIFQVNKANEEDNYLLTEFDILYELNSRNQRIK